MEIHMNDHDLIELYIRRARLEHSRAVGDAIATVIVSIWSGLKKTAHYVNVQAAMLTKTPDSYSTSLRHP
jgi:hypothetical protein